MGKQFVTIAVAMLVATAFVMPVSAQSKSSDFNLTTSPVYVTVGTTPGVPVETPLRVQNNAVTPVTLRVKLLKFKAYGATGKAQLEEPAKDDPSVKWVTFSADTIVAQPGKWNDLTMRISPPKTAAFGYYYAVTFSPVNGDQTEKPITAVNGSSAILVLADVRVPGEKRHLEVERFASQHRVYEFLPAAFDIQVKNTGDIHTAPTGDIYISKNKKDTLAVLPINSGGGNILPGTNRQLSVKWLDGFPAHVTKKVNGQVVNDKDGQPQTELSWDASKLNKLRFGKYYAKLTMVYNNGTRDVPVESELSFWVIPWKVLLVTLLVIGLILFGLYTALKPLLRRIIPSRHAGK